MLREVGKVAGECGVETGAACPARAQLAPERFNTVVERVQPCSGAWRSTHSAAATVEGFQAGAYSRSA